ncbi:MAG: heparinase II/III-family protein [Oscillospiraceae bacterium]|nr:heparinase II/III-family protein [Oscillospiraceae bacterium]
MIYELLKEKELAKNLSLNYGLQSIPTHKNRIPWEGIPEDHKQYFKQVAIKLKEKKYPILPATLYMDFVRTGDRERYQALYFERRRDLMTLSVAECIEDRGEYIDPIIDLVWAICEESSWVIPAHNYKCEPSVPQSAGELPNIEYPTNIDLFSAETGALISIVCHLLGDMIEKAAPTVRRRMEIEVKKRLIDPYLEHDYFWSGFSGAVNNWNPWINSSAMVAFAVFEKDMGALVRGIEKTAKSVDGFIRCYLPDGACDEGPSYFGVAAASMFDYLETLFDLTNMEIDIYKSETIKNMARYIYRVYIGRDYFVNFADCPARFDAPAKLMARVGEKIGDDNLVGFGEEIYSQLSLAGLYSFFHCHYRTIKSMFSMRQPDKKFAPPKTHWFAGTQILTARDDFMFVSAKGGHNAEGHNHNDVGNFMVYSLKRGANPVAIDAGVETYSKKTFSAERYDIWTMQSCYHNLPTINGFDQLPGPQSRASEVNFSHEKGSAVLSMQLKEAYPKNAGIESYLREFTFEHGSHFAVRDRFRLAQCNAPLVLHLMCYNKPILQGEKNLINLGSDIAMSFDASELSATIEEIELTDEKIKRDWKRDFLYRIKLTAKEQKNESDFTLRFAACE